MKISLGAKIIRDLIKLSKAKEIFQTEDEKEMFKRVKRIPGKKHFKPNNLVLKSKIIKQEDEYGLEYLKNHKVKDPKNVIVYYNGGAWIFGFSIFHYRRLEEMMKIYQADAIAVKYPLLPEHTSKEIRNRFKDVYKKIEELSKGKNLILMGDSAGGHSALIQTIIAKKQERRIPDKIVLLSPAIYSDLDESLYEEYEEKDVMLSSKGTSLFQKLMVDDDISGLSDPLLSPGRSDLSYFPPIEIYIGNHDVMCAQSLYFYENNKDKANINLFVYDKMFHDFMIYPIKERKKVFEEMKKTANNFDKNGSNYSLIK